MQQETAKTKKAAPTAKATVPTVKATNEVALAAEFTDGGWDQEKIDTRDILIPKVLLMHPTSDLVKKGERTQGEIIKSTSGELLASRKDKLEVIVFEKWKTWRIMELKDGRYEWKGEEPVTSETEDLPWDYTDGDKTMRRDKTMNFYCVSAKEATEGKAFPMKLSFTRSSYKTGAKIADSYARSLMDKQPPTRQTFKIGSELVSGDKETYFTFTVEAGTSTTEQQKNATLAWRKVIMQAKKNNLVVDHEAEETQTAGTATEF
jgi:hypothetical protein